MMRLLTALVPVGEAMPGLDGLAREVEAACAACGLRSELLLVGWAGGREAARSAAALPPQSAASERRALLLARASGEAAATAAGLRRATGEAVLVLDPHGALSAADLDAALSGLGAGIDVVVVRRGERRADGLWRRAAEWLLGAPAAAPGPSGLVLVTAEAARSLPIYGNLHALLPAVARHWGLAVGEVTLPHAPAPAAGRAGASFGLSDLLGAFFLLRFARLPLRFFGPIGLLLLAAGTAVDAFLVYQKIAHGQGLSDRPLLLLGTLMMVLGVQALSLGLVAELLVFIHARRLRDYRIAEEWSGAAAMEEALRVEGLESPYQRAGTE